MKQLFIDTNIIIDLFAERKPYYKDAAKIFSLADQNKVALYTSALSFANINYVLSKQLKRSNVKSILRKLQLIVKIVRLDEKIIGLAIEDQDFTDFEDALQYYTALENEMDIIITRNLRDFKNSKLPVMSADQLVL